MQKRTHCNKICDNVGYL